MPSVIDILTCSSCQYAEELSFTMVDKQPRSPQQYAPQQQVPQLYTPSHLNRKHPPCGFLTSLRSPLSRSFALKQGATIKKEVRMMNKSSLTSGKAHLERLGTIQQQSSVQENVGWQQTMSEGPYFRTLASDLSSTAEDQLKLQNSILRKEHQNLLKEAEVLKKEREFGWKTYMIKMAHAAEIEAELSGRNNRQREKLNQLHGRIRW